MSIINRGVDIFTWLAAPQKGLLVHATIEQTFKQISTIEYTHVYYYFQGASQTDREMNRYLRLLHT